MTDPRTDRELLVASRVDTAAFEELYRRHVSATIRFAARRAERPSDVVDLVADTVAPALRQGLRELPPSERAVAELV